MTSLPRSERNLPALLEDLYLGPSPDYRDDLLAGARRTRQRPAWSFPERWLPVDLATRLSLAPRYPIRAIAIALLVVAVVVAGAIAYIGSQQHARPAPPFGPAKNGAIVFALGGDIYLGDMSSGLSHPIVATPEFDRNPLVSPDGTRLAFLRTTPGSTADAFDLMVADIDGSHVRTISTAKVHDGDPGVWSPDGSFLLLTTGDGDLVRYDVMQAKPTVVAHQTLVHDFQPPAGGQVLVERMDGDRSLGLMNPDGKNLHYFYTIPAAETADGCDFGSVQFTPDGNRIVFMRRPAGDGDGCRVYSVNVDGTGLTRLTNDPHMLFETDIAVSPDGTQVAFDRWDNTVGSWAIQPIGVVSIEGGQTRSVGPTPVPDGAAFTWSPDGKEIISTPGTVTGWPPSQALSEAHPTIIDVATGAFHEGSWTMSSWPTWQRVGP